MKLLIADKVHKVLFERLSAAGFELGDFQNATKEEILTVLSYYDGIILRSKIKFTKDILSLFPNIKLIARVGSGLENIDLVAAKELNITVINSPEGNRDSVAERTVAFILMLLHKIVIANNQVKSNLWNRFDNRPIELSGKTVGIIGYGNMGSAVAKRLSAFDVKVISYDKYKFNYSDGYTQEVQMDEIFDKTDILTLHVPLQHDTYYLVNNDYLKNFKKNIFLINTSRGHVVKTVDLVENLKKGKVLGAALDVIEYEAFDYKKLENIDLESWNYLCSSPNVIITPHTAGISFESEEKLALVIAKKIINSFAVK